MIKLSGVKATAQGMTSAVMHEIGGIGAWSFSPKLT
jgi:hypothetical protein